MLVVSVVTSPQEWQGLIEASAEDLMQMAADARSFSPEQLQELLAIFTQAEDSLRLSAHPRFVLETAAVRATRLLRRADGKSAQTAQQHSAGTPISAGPSAHGPAGLAGSFRRSNALLATAVSSIDGSCSSRSDAVEVSCCREYGASTRPLDEPSECPSLWHCW